MYFIANEKNVGSVLFSTPTFSIEPGESTAKPVFTSVLRCFIRPASGAALY